MKALFISILFCLSFFFLSSCTIEGGGVLTTSTYIFVDITDTTAIDNILTEKQVDEIVSSMGLNKGGNIFNGGSVKIFLIDDVSMSRAKTWELPKGNSGFFDGQPELRRQQDVKESIKELKEMSSTFLKKVDLGKTQSEVYRNLCKEFKNLLSQPSDKKNVIIYSDMLEYSSVFSLYKYPMTAQEIKSIIKKADGECKMPNLEEINVYIVPPINVTNKDLVSQAEKFWSELFEAKGVKTLKFDLNLDMK